MANDAVLLSAYQDFLTELMVKLQLVFGHSTVLLGELTGLRQDPAGAYVKDPNQQRFSKAMDSNREYFHGKQVTIPLQLSEVPGSAVVAEGGTWPDAAPFDTDQATLNLISRVSPIAVSLELERDAKNGQTSAMESVAAYTQSAYRQHARVDNDFLNGNGDAILALSTSANSDADGLVMTVRSTTNFDQLTPGRVVDICSTSYADPGQGKRRKIASVDRSANTVTFQAAQVASDGGSGNITLSTNDLVIAFEGSIANGGKAPQGIKQATATSGTFEGIAKGSVAQWQGVSVAAGSVTLSDDILDTADYYLMGNGAASDFAVAHPLTISPYRTSMQSQVRLTMQETTIRSGVKGIIHQGSGVEYPVIPEISAARGEVRIIQRDTMRIYGDGNAPGFIDDDGSMWRFFARNSKKEADLYDRWQLGVRDCGKNAQVTGLSE
jgi:hypothetical protein